MKIKSKERWLKLWWQKNLNTFLYATENPKIQTEIAKIRKYCTDDETGNTPKELSRILKKSFIKDSLLYLGSRELKWGNCPAFIENDECYAICKNESGIETRRKFENPFHILDADNKFEASFKPRLIEMLANIDKEKNKWILNPQLFIDEGEGKTIHPSSHILHSILHRSGILFQLKMHILDKLNLDYFVFWPMFFYYTITNDLDFVYKNAFPPIYPIRIYALREGGHIPAIVMRLYGDCNFNEIHNFLKEKKRALDQLTKLMGNSNVSGGKLDFQIYKEKDINRATLDAYGEKITVNSKNDILTKGYIRKALKGEKTYLNALSSREPFKKKEKQTRVIKSQTKKEIATITHVKPFSPKVEKLIDEINNPRI